jgi:Mn-containing catalase
MFIHNKKLQYTVRVDAPDPVFARQLQELIGGKYGEISVMMQYLFQGWGLRGDLDDPRLRKIKDMLLDTGTEEIAHVEMLASCVGMLLSGASASAQETAAARDPLVMAQLAGMNPQHAIVSGMGALPADSVGNPWRGDYATASGNIVADLYANATAEMNGRLQACRVYELTNDSGVRDMLRFMIARDHMHQMQWLAAIEELGGPTATLPVPASFPLDREMQEYAFAFMGYSSDPGMTSGTGRWAKGASPDGKGNFTYMPEPFAAGQEPHLPLAPATEWSHLADMKIDGSAQTMARSGANQATMTTGTGEGKLPADQDSPSLVQKVGDFIKGTND